MNIKYVNSKALWILIIIMVMLPLTAQERNSVTAGGVTLEWSISGDYMDIQMQAPGKGWVSVGFNPSSVMKDADFYLGYVENGQVFLRDDFGSSRISHVADTSRGGTDNTSMVEGEETDSTTTIRFRIPLDSGDSNDHKFVSGEEIPVLFAYNSSKDNFTSKHSGKGKMMITFEW